MVETYESETFGIALSYSKVYHAWPDIDFLQKRILDYQTANDARQTLTQIPNAIP